MEFLVENDFVRYLIDADRETLQTNQPEITNAAEALALAETRRMLAGFTTGTALAGLADFLNNIAYATGARVVHEALPFVALQNVPAGSSPYDTIYWQQKDGRHTELVWAVLQLTIYNLAGRLPMGTLPTTLAARAAEARLWLAHQASGEAKALLTPLNQALAPRMGSLPSKADGGTIWS